MHFKLIFIFCPSFGETYLSLSLFINCFNITSYIIYPKFPQEALVMTGSVSLSLFVVLALKPTGKHKEVSNKFWIRLLCFGVYPLFGAKFLLDKSWSLSISVYFEQISAT